MTHAVFCLDSALALLLARRIVEGLRFGRLFISDAASCGVACHYAVSFRLGIPTRLGHRNDELVGLGTPVVEHIAVGIRTTARLRATAWLMTTIPRTTKHRT